MNKQAHTATTLIKKSDDDRMIVYGEVYAPNRLDTQGEMMTAEGIEEMAHRFMRLKLDAVIDRRHDNNAVVAHVIESFIAREGDPDYTAGAWVLGVKIEDQEVWDEVKKGDLNGFSFQAMVVAEDTAVEYEVVRDHFGKTEEVGDHDHFFYVKVNDIGRVVSGVTSKAADGHFHTIERGSVTQKTESHSHRYFF